MVGEGMAHDTICTGSKVRAVADAIRAKGGTEVTMTLDEMPGAVASLPTGSGGGVAALVARTLTSIPEADTITAVGEYAFSRCSALTGEVVLPNAEVIWHSSFDRCYNVTALVAPKCTRLYTLGDMSGLERLELPMVHLFMDNLRTPKLRLLYLPECTDFRGQLSGGTYNCATLERIRLPKATTMPPDGSNSSLANNIATLTSVSLEALTEAHGYTYGNPVYLLNKCATLTSVYLPSVVTLGGCVFCDCTSLTSLWLPSCTQINGNSIGKGTPIETLVLPGETMCRLSGNLNSNVSTAKGTGYVYVTSSLVEDYPAASGWSNYAAQIRAIEDYPDVVAAARALAESAAQGWD